LSDNNLLIFYSKLLDEINQFLEDLSNNKKYFEDSQIKEIDNFFRTIQRLQRIYFDNKKKDFKMSIDAILYTSFDMCVFVQKYFSEKFNAKEYMIIRLYSVESQVSRCNERYLLVLGERYD
jgi:glutaredoxin-related protein